ncbi:MAG TPA: fumarylacetoacetate hydrolase family protein [Actinospica sp.]|nr:fumarylacetoacetate hydrolase family protein [Actinospica sp.]
MTTVHEAVPFALGVFARSGAAAASTGASAAASAGAGRGGRDERYGRDFAGLVLGERVRDVSALGTVENLLADWDAGFAVLGAIVEGATGSVRARDADLWHDLADLDVRCPVRPGQILQCGANYRRHVVDIVMAERRADLSTTGHNSEIPEEEVRAWAVRMMDERARSGSPYVFSGLPSALTGPHDEIVLPERGTDHDWELELALVIGRPARRLTRENALDHVAGYTICNDLTTRSLVYRRDLKAIGTDWFAAKNAPGFLPTGPYLVPAAFVRDPSALQITLRHNGIVRQDESASDMLFDIPAILEYITSVTELRPGDLVLTGSPAGNGAHWGVFLEDGDVLEGEITGLGAQRNRLVRKRNPK